MKNDPEITVGIYVLVWPSEMQRKEISLNNRLRQRGNKEGGRAWHFDCIPDM